MNSAESLGIMTVWTLGVGLPFVFDLGFFGYLAGIAIAATILFLFEKEKKQKANNERGRH